MSFNDNGDLWDDDEQEAFDRETRDIGGFSFNAEMPVETEENIFETVDELLANSEEVIEALTHEATAAMRQIQFQIMLTFHNIARLEVLEEIRALSQEDAFEGVRELEGMVEEMQEVAQEQEKNLYNLNDKIHDFFKHASKSAESAIKEGVADTVRNAKSVLNRAKRSQKFIAHTLDSTKKLIAETESELANATSQEERTRLQKQLDQEKKTEADLVEEGEEIGKEVEAASTAAEAAQAAYDTSTMKRSVNALDWAVKKQLFDSKKLWIRLDQMSNRMHTAGGFLTKGFAGYAKMYEQGSAEASEFVAEALGFADKEAARESKTYIAALQAIESSKGSEEEVLEQLAKYLTPSSRLMMTTEAQFVAVRDMEGIWEVTRWGNYLGVGIKRAGPTILAGIMDGVESVVGPDVAAGLLIAFGVIGEAAVDALLFYFGPELLLIELEWNIKKEFFRDGFTLKFLDDVLSNFWLSLEMFSPALKLKEYKDYSSVIGTQTTAPQLKLMFYDSLELATVIDFWGDQYIKLMRKDGHKYPEYKKLRPFRAILRVPGKYIRLDNHPNESEQEIRQCQEIEAVLGLNTTHDDTAFYSRSQVNSWFPKRKGTVRNLRDFPVYDQTMQWPDTRKGIPVQQAGYFSEQDLDPTIVACFKLWAVHGTYGPAYNRSPSRRVRFAAVKANQADLEQWLNPDINYPLVWTEIKTWVHSLSGMKGIMLSDMIKLAPKQWLYEWDHELKIDEVKDWHFPHKMSGEYTNVKAYEMYKNRIGRYTYHPRDRQFLRNAQRGRVADLAFYNDSRPYYRPVEEYPEFGGAWYTYYRRAKPGESEKYGKILQEGVAWLTFIESRSSAIDDKWSQYIVEQIWGDYIRTEKPTRTVWSYITRHRQFYIEELQYVCNTMAGTNRAKVWKRYAQLLAGTHVPLKMNSIHRVTFMGMFAALAYPETAAKDTQFIKQIEKKFGPIQENVLITTDPGWKRHEWAYHVTKAIVENTHDFPVMYGDVHVRIFVLDKPRVLVVASKGTTHASEWLINLDFTMSEFVTHEVDKKENYLNVHDVPTDTKSSTSDLIGADGFMTVHRGFLRAMRALQPGVVDTMNEMFKKYNITDVFMTGHSLGAALTQLLAMVVPRVPIRHTTSRLINGGDSVVGYKNPNAYMFSSPAVGDERFARVFSHSTGESAQVWIDGDVIVMTPPFLLPDKNKWANAYTETISSYKVLIKGEGKGFAAFLWVLHELYKYSKLPDFLDGTELFEDFNKFDKSKLRMVLEELSKAANENRTVRGGQVFFRMGGLHQGDFIESAYDSGNSISFLYKLVTTPDIAKHLTQLHNIENVVATLSLAAKNRPDLFDIDAEDLPSWDDGGTIDPYDPANRRNADKKMKKIAKQLKDGSAKIIGYAKTKHHHRAWTFVDKADIEARSSVYYNEDQQNIINGLEHSKSVKRRKTQMSDPSYHGHDYL